MLSLCKRSQIAFRFGLNCIAIWALLEGDLVSFATPLIMRHLQSSIRLRLKNSRIFLRQVENIT